MSDIVEKCKFALQALNDWAPTYAPDMCDPDTVEKAKARVLEHGTLAYIANATDQLHAAIQLLSEAEKREREARVKALEDAAKVARDISDENRTGWKDTLSAHTVAKAIDDRIRALQSEER